MRGVDVDRGGMEGRGGEDEGQQPVENVVTFAIWRHETNRPVYISPETEAAQL